LAEEGIVLRLDWNSLEVGDRVMVHDTDDVEQRLMAGVVMAIATAPGSAEVTVRVASAAGGTRMIQPQRLTVHHDPVKFDSQCWRCAGSGPASPAPTRHRPRYG
jgi:hypothetical protein